MSSDQRSLEEIVRQLPPDSQAKVRQFVELLQETTNGETNKRLEQNWAGALSDYRERFTSLQLQQKASKWRSN